MKYYLNGQALHVALMQRSDSLYQIARELHVDTKTLKKAVAGKPLSLKSFSRIVNGLGVEVKEIKENLKGENNHG